MKPKVTREEEASPGETSDEGSGGKRKGRGESKPRGRAGGAKERADEPKTPQGRRKDGLETREKARGKRTGREETQSGESGGNYTTD